jgi:hypothetical protein
VHLIAWVSKLKSFLNNLSHIVDIFNLLPYVWVIISIWLSLLKATWYGLTRKEREFITILLPWIWCCFCYLQRILTRLIRRERFIGSQDFKIRLSCSIAKVSKNVIEFFCWFKEIVEFIFTSWAFRGKCNLFENLQSSMLFHGLTVQTKTLINKFSRHWG